VVELAVGGQLNETAVGMAGMMMLVGLGAGAAVCQPFVSGSLQQIVEAQRGKPFVLMFWSLDCTHCQHDLRQWGKLSQAQACACRWCWLRSTARSGRRLSAHVCSNTG
jgi:thiol-disulfide isomerase/thioredoxin